MQPNKQIVYSKFIPRLFSTLLDLNLIALLLSPVLNYLSLILIKIFFRDYFIQNNIDLNDTAAIYDSMLIPDFLEFLTLGLFFQYIFILFAATGLLMSFYFVGFWHYFGATPGKMILKMKIVDSENYSKPSLYRLIKRYFYYITAFIGIWSIVVSSKGQALHDKASNTVVIKS